MTKEDFTKLAEKHLFALEGYEFDKDGNTKLKVFGIEKLYEALTIPVVSGSFSIVVWNKIENRPATNNEINLLINGDDDNEQLFIAWNKVIVTEEDKGQIHLHIDSGEEDNYEIRYLSNYR